ncbi:translation initiation factor 3 subunit 3 [Coprinopsis marcescibilis]|uniref:Eukaryotic translation initiation factor 3 subunit H n=1 Tax=Coprinopsis marcescibilis TaxID=230819 RepID=A0A5C3LBT7_COPMA|nr:translation initiation factor 3 subunit 3 [Coprinopsis marcescibilis]
MAAPSMAAALAANLPSAPVAPVQAAPKYEALPSSMAKLIDIEADIPLNIVQLDGLVVTKIIKHAREAPSTTAHGLLLGLDLDGVLEISNSFPLPHHGGDDGEKGSKSIARHQASMLRSLKEVQADDSVVGFYQATTLGAFFNQSLLETQAIHQEKLRHGGIVIIHDLSQTARGNASFRAFRLTAAFLDAYKRSSFSTSSLISHRLTFSSILEEVPLRIRTNPLLSSFLGSLTRSTKASSGDVPPANAAPASTLAPSFSVLDLNTTGTTRNLEQIVDSLESYRTEEGNLSYLSRQIARERAKADAYIAKRKDENQTRVAQGLAPLPEEDVSRMFKIPAEPSRLDSLVLLGQIDGYAKNLEVTASTGLVKMHGAKGGSGSDKA